MGADMGSQVWWRNRYLRELPLSLVDGVNAGLARRSQKDAVAKPFFPEFLLLRPRLHSQAGVSLQIARGGYGKQVAAEWFALSRRTLPSGKHD
eukprot:2289231-Karenia_brevis.AAC.1